LLVPSGVSQIHETREPNHYRYYVIGLATRIVGGFHVHFFYYLTEPHKADAAVSAANAIDNRI
jgi:hypothetical protein